MKQSEDECRQRLKQFAEKREDIAEGIASTSEGEKTQEPIASTSDGRTIDNLRSLPNKQHSYFS